MPVAPLYQLTAEAAALNEALARVEDADDPQDEDYEAAVYEWLRSHEADVGAKVEAYWHVVAEDQAHAEVVRREEDRLRARRQAIERRTDRMKAALLAYLTASGQAKVKTPIVTVSVCNNGGRVPVEFDPDAEVPDEFMRQPPPVVDNDAVRAALEAGEPLPFAKLGARGQHVRFR